MPSPCIADTNCIHLALTGVPAVLSASPIIENTATGGVNLVCGASGLADRVDSGLALPGAPKTRDEFYAGSGDPGVIWHLRYVTGRNKWQFLGGAALMDRVDNVALENVGSYGAPVDLATVGPSVVVPFAGSYRAQWGAIIAITTLGAQTTEGRMLLKVGGSVLPGYGAFEQQGFGDATAGLIGSQEISASTTQDFTAAAGDTVIAKYEGVRVVGTGDAGFLARWLLVTPLELS